ncbi:MAG TPA: glycerophosphodiester phosphodiesterase [Terriglobales bacterium]|nr:glycerophosphodiester phosphodiesterase [Terriglobales bacterium]
MTSEAARASSTAKASAVPGRRPLLLAHRGARLYAPENTIAAFEFALAHGCDGFECDVRLTVDGEAVICHDPKLYALEVSRSNYRELVERSLRNQGGDGGILEMAHALVLPKLETVLKTFATSAFLNIELKVRGLENIAMDVLNQYPPKRGCVVSSFLPETLEWLHELGARFDLGLICETKGQFSVWSKLPVKAVMLHHRLVDEDRLRELREAGKQIFVWTVNTEEGMRYLAGLGVDGIISDDTVLLTRTLGGDPLAAEG